MASHPVGGPRSWSGRDGVATAVGSLRPSTRDGLMAGHPSEQKFKRSHCPGRDSRRRWTVRLSGSELPGATP
jgi:hypothetical protein